MKIVTKEEYLNKREIVVRQIAQGALFIFPSDTTYRLGCDATNPHAVKKLRKLKKTNVPFSVIAPSRRWIRECCHVEDHHEDSLELLPGRYVFIMGLKKKNSIARDTNNGLPTIGVRMPRNWTQEVATLLGRPLVTTSANIAGKSYMTNLENLDPNVKKEIDFCLYEGEIRGSTISVVDLSKSTKMV